MADIKDELAPWLELSRELSDSYDLLELADSEGDEAMGAEVAATVPSIRERLDRLEFRLTLSGSYDRANAILAVHAGAGGTDAQDWANMLLRMYLRWAERRRFATDTYDLSPGEEAGVKSATIAIAGPYAFGYLKSERGVHRLVRQSPFDSGHRRHTSFALVEVLPDVDMGADVTINPEDVKFEAYRSGGPGGQNVNKVSSAVRMTHVPTGIVVTCQTERSQLQNRETALRILRAKLLEIDAERREAERLELRGQHVEAGWGNQIRSYVIHPYNMVKDLRTGYETSDPNRVLDGDLDEFMNAYLTWSVGGLDGRTAAPSPSEPRPPKQ
ncbi:MAG: peptide chain release factor 2 [Chloroflexi bacterium]|nr:peptide chain release factor 2 [Chloroflexota bacterium]